MKRTCALVVVVAATAFLVPGAGGAAPKGWQTLPITGSIDRFVPLGFVHGRVWFGVQHVRLIKVQGLPSSQTVLTVWSARVQGGRLTAFVQSPEPVDPAALFSGSSLVYPSGTALVDGSAPLLASGKLGTWAPLAGAPAQTAQTQLTPANMLGSGRWAVRAEGTIGGHSISIVQGSYCPASGGHQCGVNGGGFGVLAACCVASGAATDLTSLLTDRTKSWGSEVLGTDAHGRLWLAWLDDTRATDSPALVNLVQLDPATLQPRGAKKQINGSVLGSSGTSPIYLTCGDTCRVVYDSADGAYSWGGDGPATKLWSGHLRTLIAIDGHASTLRVASYTNTNSKGADLTVVRGGASGRNLRTVGSTVLLQNIPHQPTYSYSPTGSWSMFVPQGLVTFAVYTDDRVSKVFTLPLASLIPAP